MRSGPGFFMNDGKISKVTEVGLPINVYPSGVVAGQHSGQPHSDDASDLPIGFSGMSAGQMKHLALGFFRR